MSATAVVTVKEILPLYKGEEPATNIELLTFDENDFTVVRQKGLCEVGEHLLLVYPDFNLPDTPLFADYIRPGGDESKTKLGKNNRVRAIKFNLHTGDNKPVFSNGIVFSEKELVEQVDGWYWQTNEITKLSEESESNVIRSADAFPNFLYKTDEENFLKVNHKFPSRISGYEKIDGSSITIFSHPEHGIGICSRARLKPLHREVVIGRRKATIWEKIKMFFGFKIDLNIYETKDSDDKFVVAARPYLNAFVQYLTKCGSPSCAYALRGEVVGESFKGSGNTNNKFGKKPNTIYWYNLDVLDVDRHLNFKLLKQPKDVFEDFIDDLNVQGKSEPNTKLFVKVPLLFDQVFESRQELIDHCNTILDNDKNMEGIVITDQHGFSSKVMNLHYDSKK